MVKQVFQDGNRLTARYLFPPWSFSGRSLRVSLVPFMPYMMRGPARDNPESEHQLYEPGEGFEVYMCRMVAEGLGGDVGLEVVNVAGRTDMDTVSTAHTGEWTGSIGEMLAGRSNLVVAQSLEADRIKVSATYKNL